MTPRRDLVDTMNPAGASDGKTALTLYRHTTKSDVPKAWFLSTTGRRSDATFVPKSLCEEPSVTQLVKPHGESVERGEWRIEAWKLRELGWATSDDDRQGSMF